LISSVFSPSGESSMLSDKIGDCMLLADEKGAFVENPDCVDEAKFLALALAEFPNLADDFAEDEGLFHVQMGTFSRVAKEAIERGDYATLKRCYKIADDAMKSATPNVENAVYVSFLEHLEFDNSPYGAKAKHLLPPKLSKMLIELEEHFQMLWESQQAREAKEQDANS
jgi:hypothetical protein